MAENKMKLCDWNVAKEPARADEDNACTVSFRIANVQGMDAFVTAFQGVKDSMTSEGFDRMGLIITAGQVYSLLKNSRK